MFWGNLPAASRIFISAKKILWIIFQLNNRESFRPALINNSLFSPPSLFIHVCSLFTLCWFLTAILTKVILAITMISVFRLIDFGCLRKVCCIYMCGKIFKNLPSIIISFASTVMFKKRLQDYLTHTCYYTVREYLQYLFHLLFCHVCCTIRNIFL